MTDGTARKARKICNFCELFQFASSNEKVQKSLRASVMIRKKRSICHAVSVIRILQTSLLSIGVCQVSASEPGMSDDSTGARTAWQYVFPWDPDSNVALVAATSESSPSDRAITSDEAKLQPSVTAHTVAGVGAQLRRLQKPLGEIAFASSSSDAKTPTNHASAIFTEPPIQLMPLGRSDQAPNRYPIAALHNPLYFEDYNLERCGHSIGCTQTAVSAFKFLAHTAILPYQMIEQPWCMVECDRLDCQNRSPVPCKSQATTDCDGLGDAGRVHTLD